MIEMMFNWFNTLLISNHWVEWAIQSGVLLTGMAGQILVARRSINGFYFWVICNLLLIQTAWVTDPIQLGNLILYTFYTGMCFYSIYRWRQYEQEQSQNYPPYDWEALQVFKPADPKKMVQRQTLDHHN